jgi:predicted protein tyrosine phosphatase
MDDIFIAGHCAPTCYATLSMYPKQLDTIVYSDPGWPIPNYLDDMTKSYIHLECFDTTDVREHAEPPTREHVKTALDWSEGKEKLLVACHAGISRSSATALLIAAREWGLKEAFRILLPGWHRPNRLILKYGSELLDMPVYDEYMKWVSKHL